MSCRIIIRKCEDPHRAMLIAHEIARWAGYTPEKIYGIITEKSVCIKKEASDEEALELKMRYEALGATVAIEPIGKGFFSKVPAADASVKPADNDNDDDDDDDDETPGKLLTDKEFSQQLCERGDIFYVEGNRRVQVTETVCLVSSVLFCLYLGSRELGVTDTDFYDPVNEQSVSGSLATIVDPPGYKPAVKPPVEKQFTDRRTLQRTRAPGRGGTNGGGGSVRERIAKTGVLGLIAGQIKGHTVATGEMFAKGGFAADVDAILNGMNGLKTDGGGGVGRKGEAGIGFGVGYGSGTGGESGLGGVDDLMSSSIAGLTLQPKLINRGTLRVTTPRFSVGGSITSGRSKASIARVVQQNLAALRYAYNQRLRDKPGLKGKITVKFAIDEFGRVIFCQLEESTITDATLEVAVVDKIRFWKFDKIDKPGDVTEIVYPFVFSQ